jgi:hypothetical protein
MDSSGGEESNMSALPLENLELQALEQRKHLHERATELKTKISASRDKLNPTRNAREHFIGLTIVASAIGLISGYAAAGLFTHD